MISADEIRFFRSAGYLRVPDGVSPRQTAVMREALLREMEREVPPVRRSPDGRVVRLDRLLGRHPVFEEVFVESTIPELLEPLLGPNIEVLHNRHNHGTINLPGVADTRLHRDVLQWSRDIITVIVYLEGASVTDGCTRVVPGSQYLPFVGTPNNGGTWMDEHSVYGRLAEQALPVPMPSGGVLLIDGLAFHATGENRGSGWRPVVTMAYRSVDELRSPTSAAAGPDRDVTVVRGERIYKGSEQRDC